MGSGFGLRAIARQALSFLPGPGWIIKSSVAYGGTRAMGQSASAYFTSGVRVTPNKLASLVKKVKNLKG